jgi:hypothetical protein
VEKLAQQVRVIGSGAEPGNPVPTSQDQQMNYRNSEMKVDALVSYLNDEKINLSPAFQRGHVWPLTTRRKLLQNMVQGRPIPAIFLYKEASGSRYSYNILDGKHRLESVILFIGNQREDLKVPKWDGYFFGDAHRKHAHFKIDRPDGKRKTLAGLDEGAVRDFREYAIPTIEITLEDGTSLDEVITLFVDINQQGVAVNRFHIVKAMCRNDALLKSVFDLVAIKERRGHDIFYKAKGNPYTNVLRRLNVIQSTTPPNAKVDRMWERLLEIVLFARNRTHRQPVEILKGFINAGQSKDAKITVAERQELRRIFVFLQNAYKEGGLGASRLATDQTHFYTMITTTIRHDLATPENQDALKAKLIRLGELLDEKKPIKPKALADKIKTYLETSVRQTTHVSRRSERETMFLDIINAL